MLHMTRALISAESLDAGRGAHHYSLQDGLLRLTSREKETSEVTTWEKGTSRGRGGAGRKRLNPQLLKSHLGGS